MLDSNFIRSQFPAFSEPSLQGWAYFENAGGSYTCRQVIDRLFTYYTRTKMQGGNLNPASQAASAAMAESYVRMGEYLNVGEDEVHIGPWDVAKHVCAGAGVYAWYVASGRLRDCGL